jgi:hypothetical protein
LVAARVREASWSVERQFHFLPRRTFCPLGSALGTVRTTAMIVLVCVTIIGQPVSMMAVYVKTLIKKIPGAEKAAQALGLAPDGQRPHLLAMLPQNSIGAEIGVWQGDFSDRILKVVNPKQLHLIDPWKHQPAPEYEHALYGGLAKDGQDEMDRHYAAVCARFEAQVRRDQVKIHRGFSADVLGQFPDNFFDWVYIDGNHMYEYVKKDIDLALRKTKVGGLVTGDDYVRWHWWKDGVKKAVHEYARTPAVELIEIRDRQFVFRRK